MRAGSRAAPQVPEADVAPAPEQAAPVISPSDPVAGGDDGAAQPKKPRRKRGGKKKDEAEASTAGPGPDPGT